MKIKCRICYRIYCRTGIIVSRMLSKEFFTCFRKCNNSKTVAITGKFPQWLFVWLQGNLPCKMDFTHACKYFACELGKQDEIAVDNTNGVILRGTRIIIPVHLQTRVVKLAHKGHQWLAKTKALLRQYAAWFPNMDKAVKDEIGTCLPCQINGPTTPPEPLLTPEMPDGPWQTTYGFLRATPYRTEE
jgi:hypothetical protein